MPHDPIHITMLACDLIAKHGSNALLVAQENFFNMMDINDISAASMWLSTTNEIEKILRYSSELN